MTSKSDDVGAAVAEPSHAPAAARPQASAPSPRRVVMLVNRLKRGGGAERVVVALAAHLPRDRFEVTVVTTRSGNGPLLDTLVAQGVRHVALERRGRLDLMPLLRLLRLLRRERPAVVHSHMFGSNVWGSVLGRLARVPVVVAHEHTWSYEGQPVRRFLDGRVVGRLADAFVAVSERDRERMIRLEGVPAGRVLVLPNPFLRRAQEHQDALPPELTAPDRGPMIATIAVLRPQKALEVLLDAFAALAARFPSARLAVGGDGPRREALEDYARRLGIDDRVHFLGWWQDVGGLLRVADVAVISSDYEGSPLFALECMAHGAPLVSTDVGNVGELLGDDGVALVPPRDASALAEAIGSLLIDPGRAAAQARAASERLPRYEIDSVAQEFAALYDRLYARSSRRTYEHTTQGVAMTIDNTPRR